MMLWTRKGMGGVKEKKKNMRLNCCYYLPYNHCSNWTLGVEEILAFGNKLRSTQYREFLYMKVCRPANLTQLTERQVSLIHKYIKCSCLKWNPITNNKWMSKDTYCIPPFMLSNQRLCRFFRAPLPISLIKNKIHLGVYNKNCKFFFLV